jgi:DNA-binding transcriptional LysR family regulator
MDRLQAMATFVAVVEAGSFASALDSTGYSKAAVSRQVAELEKWLAVRLLHRTTRRLSLTEEGRHYFARCKELLADIEDIESEIGRNTGQACGRLRIGVPQDFGVEQLAGLWGRFLDENPNIELDITLSDRTFDLIEEGYDLAIRISSLPDSGMIARPLAAVRLMACASPNFLKKHGGINHPAELKLHRFISYSYQPNGDEWTFRHKKGEVTHVRLDSTIRVNNGATCRAMAIAGQGITIQPDFLMDDAVKSGKLVELFPDWSTGAESLVVHALYPTRSFLPLKVQRMRDFLIDAFCEPSWTARRI